jgi:hypothetical protein
LADRLKTEKQNEEKKEQQIKNDSTKQNKLNKEINDG